MVGLELAQNLEVEEEVPGLRIEARDIATVENDWLDRRVASFGPYQRLIEVAEHAVTGDLDLEPELLASACLRSEHRVRSISKRTGIEALDATPVHPQGRLAVGHPEQVDAATIPGLWGRRPGIEPKRAPARPELLA